MTEPPETGSCSFSSLKWFGVHTLEPLALPNSMPQHKGCFCVSTVQRLSKHISYLMPFGVWLLAGFSFTIFNKKDPTAINNSVCLLFSVKVRFLNCRNLLCARFYICLNFSPAGRFVFAGVEGYTAVNHWLFWKENFNSSAIWLAFKYISKEIIPSYNFFPEKTFMWWGSDYKWAIPGKRRDKQNYNEVLALQRLCICGLGHGY